MRSCCVDGCEVNSEDIIFFEFPTSRSLRRRWLDVIKVSGKVTIDSVICNRHFTTSDYETIRGKVRLKRKVVPSAALQEEKTKSLSPEPDIPPSIEVPLGVTLENKQPTTDHDIPAETNKPLEVTVGDSEPTIPDTPAEKYKPFEVPILDPQPVAPDIPPETNNLLEVTVVDPQPTHTDILAETNKLTEVNVVASQPKASEPPIETNKSSEVNVVASQPKASESPVETNKSSEVNVVDSQPKTSEPPIETNKSTEVSVVDPQTKSTDTSAKTNNETNTQYVKKNKNSKKNQSSTYRVSLPQVSPTLDLREDIEDMITNYQIKNKIPNNALAADLTEDLQTQKNAEKIRESSPDVELIPEAQPVFIEISVDKDVNSLEPGAGSQDCLMLLESVQVELDPSTLLLPERDYDDDDDDDDIADIEEIRSPDKKEAISLLTSSDEDDVIIQEPHIDTVEVSDETDEDDMPLVKLVKKRKKTPKKPKKADESLTRVMWGVYEYYCVQCHYTTTSRKDYKSHVSTHSTVLQICSACPYTTSSKTQYARHVKKHKDEKRYRCHLCGYKARHNMSLIYHLKSHDTAKCGYHCKKCNFKSDVRSVVLKHLKLCNSAEKKYQCNVCDYATSRRSDMKRHQLRRHRAVDEAADEYWP